MFDELFNQSFVVARYQNAPHAESRANFLRKAREEGYPISTLERIAWALLVVAQAVNFNAGPITATELERALRQRARFKASKNSSDSERTIKFFLRFGEAWLRTIGAFKPEPEPALAFTVELNAFLEHMRVERGLAPSTITIRQHVLRNFFASLPQDARTLGDITLNQIDLFLDDHAGCGWTRRSLRVLGSSLRSFFRYAAQRGWCSTDLERGIGLPCVYALEDVPQAPTVEEVQRVLHATSGADDPVKIRDHAILSLLLFYGLRRGEVEQLTLDDLDWVGEKIHIKRPKLRRAQCYPLSAPVGDAILRYLRVRPRCRHRALFLTIKAPVRPYPRLALLWW
jgi:site-specific recombinase XerD